MVGLILLLMSKSFGYVNLKLEWWKVCESETLEDIADVTEEARLKSRKIHSPVLPPEERSLLSHDAPYELFHPVRRDEIFKWTTAKNTVDPPLICLLREKLSRRIWIDLELTFLTVSGIWYCCLMPFIRWFCDWLMANSCGVGNQNKIE